MRRIARQIVVLALGAMAWPGVAHTFGPDVTAADASFRFVILSDLHVTMADLPGSRAQLQQVVDEINGLGAHVAFVLVAGDLAESENPVSMAQELMAAKQELDRLHVPYHLALGNYDVTATGDDAIFRGYFGPTSYRFAYGGVQFISLRTPATRTSTSLAQASLDSLSLFLGKISTSDPLVIFAHHPLGPVHPFNVTNRQDFYTRVDAYNLRAVFNGHYHGTFEEQRNGAWYCTTIPVSQHRSNNDGTWAKGYRVASVWPDRSLSSQVYELGSPPQFAPAAPVFVRTANRLALAGRTLRLALAARDAMGGAITYSAAGLPAGASFDPVQRLLQWTPGSAQAGLFTGMRFLASNGSGTDTLRLAMRVLPTACVYEDFEAAAAGWSQAGGSWSVQGGTATQTLTSGGSYYLTAGTYLSELYLEADLEHQLGVGYAGLVFRYQDASNNYYLWNNGSQIEVRRRVNGTAYRLVDPVPVGSVVGWHHVRVEAVGAHMRVYWDGELKLEVDDATFASGQIGLVCSQSAARFDNVIASGCSGFYGRPPALESIGSRTVVAGTPVRIDLHASDPDAQPLLWSARGLPPGARFDAALQRFTWTPLPQDAGVWRGTLFRASDGELDDAEAITLTVLDTTGACLYDDFEDAAGLGKWMPSNGSWTVAGGAYVGTSAATALSSVGQHGMQDYTLQARIRVEGQGYGNLAFRIADATHYYYLYTSSSNRTVELRKMQGASSIALASDGEILGAVQDHWHLYRVQVQGDVIRVWVDGERRFEVRDRVNPYLSGRVGLRVVTATLRTDDLLVRECTGSSVDAPAADLLLRGLRCSPNPFNPRTTVSFELGAASHAELAIFDVRGRVVRRLFDGTLPAGAHRLMWDGLDEAGQRAASGIYYLRARAGDLTETRNLVLVK